jgi:hypothetical protein
MAANKGFSLDFKGFLDFAEDISEQYGEDMLLYAAEQALQKTKEYVNGEIASAMENSKYNFDKGEGYAQGTAKESLAEVTQKPVEVSGTVVTAYAGVDLEQAPEALILAYGAPHLAKDTKLYNAIKVKGKVKKEVDRIQRKVFDTVLSGGAVND